MSKREVSSGIGVALTSSILAVDADTQVRVDRWVDEGDFAARSRSSRSSSRRGGSGAFLGESNLSLMSFQTLDGVSLERACGGK